MVAFLDPVATHSPSGASHGTAPLRIVSCVGRFWASTSSSSAMPASCSHPFLCVLACSLQVTVACAGHEAVRRGD